MKPFLSIIFFFVELFVFADSDRMAHEQLRPDNAPPTLEQVSRLGYALGYDPSKRQPLWVAYRLRREDVEGELVEREGTFLYDYLVSNSPQPYDYVGSGYDRGHMAPAGDMGYNHERMRESFFMSNMSPQLPYINRGIWRSIETFVRDSAKKFGEVFVVTGPIFEGADGFLPSQQKSIKLNGGGDIPVPVAYYKVLYTKERGEMMLSFLVENSNFDEKYWMETAPHPTLDIERLTGLRFFADIDADESLGLRKENDIRRWL